jgi:hypothetical protein
MMLLTQRGTSGSPLVRIENNQLKAIGIHKAKKKKKKKKNINEIVKIKISTNINNFCYGIKTYYNK